MRVFKVEGKYPLNGTIEVSGAKNSVVALIPAAILAGDVVILENVPELSDVYALNTILKELNVQTTFENNTLTIDATNVNYTPLIEGAVQELRASYYLMGAMLARYNEAIIGMPGGCYLGPRPIDLHLKGFQALGAEVKIEHGAYRLHAQDGLKGAKINLDIPSVGATINIMLAAVHAEGTTVIENVAKEPEIVDIATMLNNMGARITGAGTDTIRVKGVSVDSMHGCRHQVIPDRIEAGTYMVAAAIGVGEGMEVKVDNIIPEHMEAFLAKMHDAGVNMEVGMDSVTIRPTQALKAVNVKTGVFPGFATDLQQPFTLLLTQATGASVITDTIYSARFKHVDELQRMGASIRNEASTGIVVGPSELEGAKVTATDLRAGAAMVLAGLIASGITEIHEIEHVERGYERIIQKLTNVGAKIWFEEI
ncbi:MAG: UDP-N-acetylglucosamine 1-carboxyvinyltransferase [Culicoidibacterales bacterium]